MALQMYNVRQSAAKLTALGIACGDDTSERVEERWKSTRTQSVSLLSSDPQTGLRPHGTAENRMVLAAFASSYVTIRHKLSSIFQMLLGSILHQSAMRRARSARDQCIFILYFSVWIYLCFPSAAARSGGRRDDA